MSEFNYGENNKIFYTLTSLNRWSIANKKLPAIEDIKSLHIYDFDNTLFNSPLPNHQIWNALSINFLQSQDTFLAGGWWHDQRFLEATGEGIEKEEPKAWKGWWNEKIVELVELSMRQKDALTVLLTGRSETGFSILIKKMLKSKKLDFDIICLKPLVGPNNERFASTMIFKKMFLECLMETYKKADELRIYEDRVKHTKAFRDFFSEYNKAQLVKPTRGKIAAEVIQVADRPTLLDPVSEIAQVQRLINDHNMAISQGSHGKRDRRLQIKKTASYTGYLIKSDDSQKLIRLARIPSNLLESEVKIFANNILISSRPASDSILERVGGMGNKISWEVTGTAVFENKIWAARVRPVPGTRKYYTENSVPIVVLALRRGARLADASLIQNWQPAPVNKKYIFESTVSEKVMLRIEEDLRGKENDSINPSKSNKRKRAHDDDTPNQERNRPYCDHSSSNKNSYQQSQIPGLNSRGSPHPSFQRGYRGSSLGRGRIRGGGPTYIYRSLDDVDRANSNIGFNAAVAYEDYPRLH
ncbi:putative tat pathway signal sequence protein [Erysiphe neolycopersici]|uniref:Putative tat pathway signal sequence protein n=1 Tax=Erysiphe neolycopersici TaxID=212602 RepID=A0A420I5G7_9PEZI|nr:putative tat pathway signal sequence protein [Erysiphe neolycopersici]